ncbi:uncharacterized protein SCODWIG_02120 [Saccharomycodes ludwigii]|uniref:Uncharacterized protein n=1 Tax=Saccharomycodes ludwigii TaxID=36035 RepID=A0A376B700_9ASCO|nr:uncharacterized protein SCODWIG_02120 [Saccharomycodes ludwigii]
MNLQDQKQNKKTTNKDQGNDPIYSLLDIYDINRLINIGASKDKPLHLHENDNFSLNSNTEIAAANNTNCVSSAINTNDNVAATTISSSGNNRNRRNRRNRNRKNIISDIIETENMTSFQNSATSATAIAAKKKRRTGKHDINVSPQGNNFPINITFKKYMTDVKSCTNVNSNNTEYLILNYFIISCFEESTIKLLWKINNSVYSNNFLTGDTNNSFNKESDAFVRLYKIRERLTIMNLINNGDVLKSIEAIGDLFGVLILEQLSNEYSSSGVDVSNPPVKDTSSKDSETAQFDKDILELDLFYKLLLLHMIETIKKYKYEQYKDRDDCTKDNDEEKFIMGLMNFSREKLSTRCLTILPITRRKKYFKFLQYVMMLLLYPSKKLITDFMNGKLPIVLQKLFDSEFRLKLSEEVNYKLLKIIYPDIVSNSNIKKWPVFINMCTSTAGGYPSGNNNNNNNNNNDDDDGGGGNNKDVFFEIGKLVDPFGKNINSNIITNPIWKRSNSLVNSSTNNVAYNSTTTVSNSGTLCEPNLVQIFKLWQWGRNEVLNNRNEKKHNVPPL